MELLQIKGRNGRKGQQAKHGVSHQMHGTTRRRRAATLNLATLAEAMSNAHLCGGVSLAWGTGWCCGL